MQVFFPSNPSEQFQFFGEMLSCVKHSNKELDIYLTGGIWRNPKDLFTVISTIHSMDPEGLIRLYLMSPGGCVQTTLDLIAAFDQSGCTLHTFNFGMAASCGSLLLSRGDKIYVAPGSSSMFHHASNDLQGSVTANRNKINSVIAVIERIFEDIIQKGILLPEELAEMKGKNTEFFLSSAQMIPRLKANNLYLEEG